MRPGLPRGLAGPSQRPLIQLSRTDADAPHGPSWVQDCPTGGRVLEVDGGTSALRKIDRREVAGVCCEWRHLAHERHDARPDALALRVRRRTLHPALNGKPLCDMTVVGKLVASPISATLSLGCSRRSTRGRARDKRSTSGPRSSTPLARSCRLWSTRSPEPPSSMCRRRRCTAPSTRTSSDVYPIAVPRWRPSAGRQPRVWLREWSTVPHGHRTTLGGPRFGGHHWSDLIRAARSPGADRVSGSGRREGRRRGVRCREPASREPTGRDADCARPTALAPGRL